MTSDHFQKRNHRKRWFLIFTILAAVLLYKFFLCGKPAGTPDAIIISFSGYTNLPNNPTRFILFNFSNQASYPILRHDNWVEIEGSPGHLAEIMNPSLPGWRGVDPVLKSGDSFTVAIGEPPESYESNRWRYSMAYVPYTFGQKSLAFSFRHNLPLKIGPLVLIDDNKLRNSSNNITVRSAWLAK